MSQVRYSWPRLLQDGGNRPNGTNFSGTAAKAIVLLLFWNQKNYFPSSVVLEFHWEQSKFGGSCKELPKWVPSIESPTWASKMWIAEIPIPKFWFFVIHDKFGYWKSTSNRIFLETAQCSNSHGLFLGGQRTLTWWVSFKSHLFRCGCMYSI